MATNLCFVLGILLMPLSIGLLNLQAAMPLSGFDHSLVEILIVCLVYWLILQIVRLDNLLYLRHITQQKPPHKATKHL